MDKSPNENPRRWDGLRLLSMRTGIISIVVVVLFAALGLYYSNIGYSVYINGVQVGIVKDKALAEEVVAEVTEEMGKEYTGGDVVVGAELEFKKVKLSRSKPLDREMLKQEILKVINVKRPGVTVMINDKPLLSLAEKEEAEAILEDIKKVFTAQKDGVKIEKVYFKEDIELVEGLIEMGKLMNKEDAYQYLLKGTTEERTYEVKKGDSLWTIAKNYGISVEDLQRANPDVDPKRLQIGQQLSLVVPKPFITVVSEERVTLKEKIPYQTKYKESSEFYKGESIVKVSGRYGIKEVTARVIRENGVQVSKEVLEEKVVKEPTDRLVAVGTKNPPPRQGTGTFSYPARGRITSNFGWRWGRRHNGIDIALPIGTPVKAADGGTVIFAGTYGGYGKLVIIDHGGGYHTYYGHNSKIMVSKGDKVFKGQVIALSGNTGTSTGPHLHFEVRKFGVPTNPLKYLQN